MKNLKFSASTSFFRRGDYVQQMYQQLLDQTHTNWEWIVTDDFSENKYDAIFVVLHPKNKLLLEMSKNMKLRYIHIQKKPIFLR